MNLRQDYTRGPELAPGEWIRYAVFACVVEIAVMAFLTLRLIQVLVDEMHWLSDVLPPVADLFFLGLAVVFSLKSMTIWRKTETHPKRRDMRTLVLVLLLNIWLFFVLGLYMEPIAGWLLVGYV